MQARTLHTWIARRISVRSRLERVCVNYLLFLMVATCKHSLEEAARFSGLNKSQFCKFLQSHFGLDRGIGHFMLFEVDSKAQAPAPPMPISPQTSNAASDRKSAPLPLSRQAA